MKATLTFDLNEDQSTMQINDLPPMEIDNFTFRDCFYTFLNRVSSKDMNEYFYLFHSKRKVKTTVDTEHFNMILKGKVNFVPIKVAHVDKGDIVKIIECACGNELRSVEMQIIHFYSDGRSRIATVKKLSKSLEKK